MNAGNGVLGYDGDDTITIGVPGADLDGILGAYLVEGGGNTGGLDDQLIIDDTNEAAGQTYTITSTTFQRTGTALVTYGTMESLTLNAGTGDDNISVKSTLAIRPSRSMPVPAQTPLTSATARIPWTASRAW